MTKKDAIRRIAIISNLLRGEPRKICGKNWKVSYRLNCIGKTLLSCVEKLERPADDTKTFEGSSKGADIYYKATMTFFRGKATNK